MLKKTVLIRGQEGNYFTSDGDIMIYPEHKLQSLIDSENITEPFLFLTNVRVEKKGKTGFINGKIRQTKPLEKIEIIDYIGSSEYQQLIKIFTPHVECLYCVEITEDRTYIKLVADIGNGLEEFVSIEDDGVNKTGFLKGLLRTWVKGTKKVDILLYQDEAKTREIAKDAVVIDEDEALYLGAYLRLKNLVTKRVKDFSTEFEVFDNKYVRYGKTVCFRTEDMWYFDALNIIPFITYTSKYVIDKEKIDEYITDNMLIYSNIESETVYKTIELSDINTFNIELVNIKALDYYNLQTEEIKGIIEDCKYKLEDLRRDVGRNATRNSAVLLRNLGIRNVIGLDKKDEED